MRLSIVGIALVSWMVTLVVVRLRPEWDDQESERSPISALRVFALAFASFTLIKMICIGIVENPIVLSPEGILIIVMACMVFTASRIGHQVGCAVNALNDWLKKVDDMFHDR